MPAASTHVEFARDVYHALSKEKKEDITYLPYYFLGSQGPDLLFFNRFNALPGSLSKVGGTMHDIKCKETITYLKTHCPKGSPLYSYYLGFLTHYVLDSNIHPLIGFYSIKRNETTPSMSVMEAHYSYEAEIDQYVLQKKHMKYCVYDSLYVEEGMRKELAVMLQGLLIDVYGVKTSVKELTNTIRDIHILTKALSPNQLKYKFVYQLESLTHFTRLISGMMLVEKTNTPDVLNFDHATYCVDDHPEITHSFSFDELYEQCLQHCVSSLEDFDLNSITVNFSGQPLQ